MKRNSLPKVLVIENEINIQKLTMANLNVSGYEVVVADDGEDGLRLAQLERPALILLDLMMPGLSGWDVLAALRADQELSQTPVVIMTAFVSERKDAKRKASSGGAVGYLTKPFTVDELLHQVEHALPESGIRNASAACA